MEVEVELYRNLKISMLQFVQHSVGVGALDLL